MSNKLSGTIYTGVTSNLAKRVYEHKSNNGSVFTKKYDCRNLVYFERHETMESAIMREKQIKGGSRSKKIKLIESFNPGWKDLYEDLF